MRSGRSSFKDQSAVEEKATNEWRVPLYGEGDCGQTKLMRGIKNGSGEQMLSYLQYRPEIVNFAQYDFKRETALHVAINLGLFRIANKIIKLSMENNQINEVLSVKDQNGKVPQELLSERLATCETECHAAMTQVERSAAQNKLEHWKYTASLIEEGLEQVENPEVLWFYRRGGCAKLFEGRKRKLVEGEVGFSMLNNNDIQPAFISLKIV